MRRSAPGPSPLPAWVRGWVRGRWGLGLVIVVGAILAFTWGSWPVIAASPSEPLSPSGPVSPSEPAVSPPSGPTSASTRVSVPGWTIQGEDSRAIHTHGGDPARLGSARFQVSRTAADPGVLGVHEVVAWTGQDCEMPPDTPRTRPRVLGLGTTGSGEPRVSLTVKPGEPVLVTVYFEAVEASYSWCDRFSFHVGFEADGRSIPVVAETWVSREEPWGGR